MGGPQYPPCKKYPAPPRAKITAPAPAPISGSPQKTDLRRKDPKARNPVVAAIGVSPISWSPDVTVSGANWLRVNRQTWRSKSDRNANAESRRGGRGRGGNCKCDEREKQ